MINNLRLSNPFLVYVIVWTMTLLLISLRITSNLYPLNINTVILVLSNLASFFLINYIYSKKYGNPVSNNMLSELDANSIRILSRLAYFMLLVWFVGSIFEILESGGLPVIWLVTHSSRNYADFGVHTFHGLMNALYLFSITALFLDYQYNKTGKTLVILFLLLLWPLILIDRCIFLGALLQISAVYLLLKKQRLRNIMFFLLGLISVILIFGIIGDLRSGYNPWMGLVNEQYKEIFRFLPSGVLWFYVYITSPLNNVVANINNLHPTYVPYYSLFYTLPSAFRDILGIAASQGNPMHLVKNYLNVSTFYDGFLADFGILGAIIIVALIQWFCAHMYFLSRNKKPYVIIINAVLFQCIIFSIFFNLFFLWVYLAQIIFAFALGAYLKLAKRRTLVSVRPTISLTKNNI